MLYKQAIRQLLAQILFVLFGLLLLNGIVFRHAHKLESGKVITHAHPYKSAENCPYQPNSHTEKELYLLDLIAHAPFVMAFAFAGLQIVHRAVEIYFASNFYYLYFSSQTTVSHVSLRGPPVS